MFTWKIYTGKGVGPHTAGKWETIELGSHTCLVRTTATPRGFLWQVDDRVGYAETLADAKLMAETALMRVSGTALHS